MSRDRGGGNVSKKRTRNKHISGTTFRTEVRITVVQQVFAASRRKTKLGVWSDAGRSGPRMLP